MAITLAEYNSTRQDKFDLSAVIDEFQKSSVLLDDMIWDDTVMPTGSSFVYGYNKVTTESGAGVRSVNGTYTASDSKQQRCVAEVKILGGKYTIDRAVAKASKDSFLDEVQFQSSQKVKATRAVFNDLFINGKATSSNGQFDGVDKLLTGSSTVFESEVDVSTSAKINENYMAFLDEIDAVIANMDAPPTHILMNTKALTVFKAVARRAAQYQETRDSMGRTIVTYAGAKLVDMGAKAGSNNPVIPTTDGVTDIYFVRIGMDGVHGITLKNNMIDVVTPDFGAQGAEQLNGLVEMYAGIALKNSKAAAKLEGVQVAAKPPADPPGNS